MCEKLGVPITEDETEDPNSEITFLGFTFDSVKQELWLPNEKVLKLCAALPGIRKNQVQSVRCYR